MSDISCSDATEHSIGWEAVVALGRLLVRQLGQDREDIALAWMAHHVARLMTEAEQERGAASEVIQERCRRAILAMWQARHAIFERRPLQEIEEVGNALLALRNGQGWFFDRLEQGRGDGPPKEVELAYVVDAGARAIIRTLLGDAIRRGAMQDQEWVSMVSSGFPVVRPIIVLLEEGEITSPEPMETTAAFRKEREAVIHDLEIFAKAAGEMAENLKGVLEGSEDAPKSEPAPE